MVLISVFIWCSCFSLVSIHHILRKTSYMLVGGLIKFLFDFALNLLDESIRPVIWVGALMTTNLGCWLVIAHHFSYFQHHLLVVTKVWEELLNQRQLRHWNLIIEFLMIRTLVLIIGSEELRMIHAVTCLSSHLAFFEVFVKLKRGRRVATIIFGRFPSWVGVIVTWTSLFDIFFNVAVIELRLFFLGIFTNILENLKFFILYLVCNFLKNLFKRFFRVHKV